MVTGEPPYPNAKVFSLDRMLRAAAHDLVVMSDSDIRVESEYAADHRRGISGSRSWASRLARIAPFPETSVWSRLEATGMNTEFLAGCWWPGCWKGCISPSGRPSRRAARR